MTLLRGCRGGVDGRGDGGRDAAGEAAAQLVSGAGPLRRANPDRAAADRFGGGPALASRMRCHGQISVREKGIQVSAVVCVVLICVPSYCPISEGRFVGKDLSRPTLQFTRFGNVVLVCVVVLFSSLFQATARTLSWTGLERMTSLLVGGGSSDDLHLVSVCPFQQVKFLFENHRIGVCDGCAFSADASSSRSSRVTDGGTQAGKSTVSDGLEV